MDSENPIYKTAELVRDAVGCYYFICLQCGKNFENLDDTVMHIEKYFSEDENVVDAITSMPPMTINEPDWMSNDSDVEAVVANIKKESFEEYEDYKLSVPDHQSDVEQGDVHPIHCPLCSETLSHTENSLESHLMVVHHRTKSTAKIYDCNICGRNSFTRSYDLERHKLTHARYKKPSSEAPLPRIEFESQRRNGDRNKHSVLLNILSQSARKPTTNELFDSPTVESKKVSPKIPSAKVCTDNKRYLSTDDLTKNLPPKKAKLTEEIDCSITSVKPSGFCSICRTTLSKKETLESHLIRVHHRNKSYAQVYECNVCGKNSFTRPYDLRRHELIHLNKGRKDRKPSLPKKIFQAEPKTDDKTVITKVPFKAETSQESSSFTDMRKIAAEIQTTNPQKDGILCAICGMKFERYLDVTMHLKVAHNKKRIYKCSRSDCDSESFNSAFLLHRHEISHSIRYRSIVGNNQNRMKCVFCRRNFNKKWNLMKHEKRHLVEMAEQ